MKAAKGQTRIGVQVVLERICRLHFKGPRLRGIISGRRGIVITLGIVLSALLTSGTSTANSQPGRQSPSHHHWKKKSSASLCKMRFTVGGDMQLCKAAHTFLS